MQLYVWANQEHIGTLVYDGQSGRFSFSYSRQWQENPSRFSLSPALPLIPNENQSVDQHSAAVRQFFQNLLPEGQALDDAAGINNISKTNLAGLLHALGRETAGALVFALPDENQLAIRRPPRPLPLDELSQRIRERPELPFTVWDNKVRLSIAGYQDKLAVLDLDGKWYLADSANLASTHILKPEPVEKKMAGMTTNELLCMRLARAVDLPTAAARLKNVPEPVLVIERFDRLRDPVDPELIHRLHCIDACQVLGLSVDFKYERPYGSSEDVRDIRDGASLKRLFDVARDKQKVPVPGRAILSLLRWVIFQVLIGNTDAHAKNISFFSSVAGLEMAPTYDLVCGLAFANANLDESLAMAIGDNFDPRTIKAVDWAQMAHENKLPAKLVANALQALATQCLKHLPEVMAELEAQGADRTMMEKVAGIVKMQCETALRSAPEISKIDSHYF